MAFVYSGRDRWCPWLHNGPGTQSNSTGAWSTRRILHARLLIGFTFTVTQSLPIRELLVAFGVH
jgi:hypothetical protein